GTGESRKEGIRAPSTICTRLCCMSSRNLVKCRVGNSGGSHCRPSRYYCPQRLNYLGIDLAGVGLRVRLRLPEAVPHGFREIRGDKDNFIQKSLLLAQHRNDFLFHQAGKFRGSLGFESNYYMTSKHIYAPVVFKLLGQMIWRIPEE